MGLDKGRQGTKFPASPYLSVIPTILSYISTIPLTINHQLLLSHFEDYHIVKSVYLTTLQQFTKHLAR